MERKFYVLRTVNGKENKVKEFLEEKVKSSQLENHIFQVIFPTVKVVQNFRGKKTSRERAFFPGYVVVEAILNGKIVSFIKSINFVAGFLGGDDPIPLRPDEINRILGKMDELQEQSEEYVVDYVIGETVKIIFGPFNGFRGEVEDVYPDKKKLKIMVKIFGRKSPLELGYLQVEKE